MWNGCHLLLVRVSGVAKTEVLSIDNIDANISRKPQDRFCKSARRFVYDMDGSGNW